MNTDIEYWRNLNPNLHVDLITKLDIDQIEFSSKELVDFQNLIKIEGYTQFGIQDQNVNINDLADTIKKFKDLGIPPVHAFIYDEFWVLFYKLNNFLEGILGQGYLRLPAFWAWHIDHINAETGWSPHRDNGRATLNTDGSPKSVTVWIPLTDATTLNSCIYIVPADRDPVYNTEQEDSWAFHPADIRALPATAGTVFCWNQAVLHWGSHSSSRAKDDRISVAFEFQQGNIGLYYGTPVSNPDDFPNFKTRLELIDKQMSQYQHMTK